MSKFGAMVMGPAGAGKVWACLFCLLWLCLLCALTPDHKGREEGGPDGSLMLVLMLMLAIHRVDMGIPPILLRALPSSCDKAREWERARRCYATLCDAMMQCYAIPLKHHNVAKRTPKPLTHSLTDAFFTPRLVHLLRRPHHPSTAQPPVGLLHQPRPRRRVL